MNGRKIDRVAVLLPTRNRFRWLRRVMRCLERQTFRDFVVRVSDNGSSDDTMSLGAEDFPQLPVIWSRREPALAGLAEHYQTLISEVTEEFSAIVHDDEVYSDRWLELLFNEMMSEDMVLSFGQTINIDARRQNARFHLTTAGLPAGHYDSETLKCSAIFKGQFFPSHGFLFKTKVAQSVSNILPKYEQYDYAWLMKVAENGLTAVRPEYLVTYTVHRSNTLNSKGYLLEYATRRQSCVMLNEWLTELPDIPTAEKQSKRIDLTKAYAGGDFRAFIRSLAAGDRQLSELIAARLSTNPMASRFVRVASSLLLMFGVFQVSGKALAAYFRFRRSWAPRPLPSPVKIETVGAIFPELLRDDMKTPQ